MWGWDAGAVAPGPSVRAFDLPDVMGWHARCPETVIQGGLSG